MRKFLIPILMMLILVGCGQPESVKIEYSVPLATAETQSKTPTEDTEDAHGNKTVPSDDSQDKSEFQPTVPEKEATQPAEPIKISKPKPADPKPTEPAQSETVMPEPPTEDTVPLSTEPEQTKPTQPTSKSLAPTEQIPVDPAPTELAPTEPAPTEPDVEQIDIAALESYGRSYASSAYGYNGTSACGPGSGAGYFPGATKQILTMADGYRFVRQAIDAQYARDIAGGYAPYEEINGVTVRCPINVRVEPTGQDNSYVIWVYYGGV